MIAAPNKLEPVEGKISISPSESSPTVSLHVISAGISKDLSALFRSDLQWVGADGAYSIPLNEEICLWTFGDTWIGTIADSRRIARRLISNSIALQKSIQETVDESCDLTDSMNFAPLSFSWSRDSENKEALALFRPASGAAYYWPADGFSLHGKLYLFLHEIVNDKTRPYPYQFRRQRDLLAVVVNPLAPPAQWRIAYHALPAALDNIHFAAACMRCEEEQMVYIFCTLDSGANPEIHGNSSSPHPLVLARITEESVENGRWTELEFFCQKETEQSARFWSRQISNPVILFEDGAAEFSVSRVSGLPGVVAIYIPPGEKRILLRQAQSASGPFTEPIELFDLGYEPEDVLVYSAKLHNHLARKPGELFITYCANSDERSHIERPDIYFPKGIRVLLRENLTE